MKFCYNNGKKIKFLVLDMKKIYFLLLLSLKVFAYSPEYIINSIKYVATQEAVKPEILYTIIKIESDFEPFAISFLTNQTNAHYFKTLETPNINIKISQYSLNPQKWVVSIKPINEAYATEIAKALIQSGFSIDVGLGQLNSVNFKQNEIAMAFNPVFNLTKCAKVLRMCFNAKNKDIQKTIECYNYGLKKRNSMPYYKKFITNYEKMFGNPYGN